ncbi:hypothetical protein E8E13_009708 [Curvularia kusanoi]|uniref:Uncharacterized protein n=1 Tax=Curvularia kusanoi TaxID=90978 RepID=A0A9P4WBI8_CURKU|nr:hypothetical protein E8E13_009708 [Curvularia kusanoi]
MRVLGLPFVSLLVSAALAQDDFDFTDCSKEDADVSKCAQKIDSVLEVTPGVSYFSKIACKDCSYAETWSEGSGDDKGKGKPESRITHGDQELFLNVTLANNTRSLYLNGKKIFPVLPTIPTPPHISVALLHPDFSYKNLTAATTCSNPTCSGKISNECTEWCQKLPLGRMFADYSYSAHIQREEADAEIRIWDIVFDPVGGRSSGPSDVDASWKFDDPERKALHIVVAGQLVRGHHSTKPPNSQSGGLFENVGPGEEYELEITKVEQVMRRFEFASAGLGFFGSVKRFFGGDVWKEEGELVFLSAEWGVWGKKGTLRNWVGNVFHSNFVGLFFIIIGSVVGGFLALRVIQAIWIWAKQQSGLARWKGIDAVYSQLNNDRIPDEEQWSEREPSFGDGYRGDYRDSYDEGPSRASMGWQDERMKPLPTKPLPEKPLPQEPLIDT